MINPEKIRAYIRDDAELNVLLDNKEQFGDEEIGMFYKDVQEELEFLYPVLRGKTKFLPDVVWVYLILSKLLESQANLENRNQMQISDDNVGQIDFSNKMQQYMSLAGMYAEKAKSMIDTNNAANFYKDMWGATLSTSSEYDNGLWGSGQY